VTVEVTDLTGSMDLGLVVMGSFPYSVYWADRSGGFWSDQTGVGGQEVQTLIFLVDDWFGLAVWNNTVAGGAYRIRLVDPGTNDVAEGTASKFDLRLVGRNPFGETVGLQYSLTRTAPRT